MMHRSFLAVSLLLFACGAESVDVGSTHRNDAGATDSAPPPPPPPGPALPDWPDPTACAASSDSDLVGVWVGDFEADDFRPVESLRVEIFGASAAGGLCGSLVVGDSEPPPPPSDPTEAYPPNAVGYFESLYPGATYTLRDGAMRGDSVHFELDSVELWKDWCALQTPAYVPSVQAWLCVPGNGGAASGDNCQVRDERTGTTETVALVQCMACMAPPFAECVCNESGCTALPNGGKSQRIEFNLQRMGDQLAGAFGDQGLNVALTRGN